MLIRSTLDGENAGIVKRGVTRDKSAAPPCRGNQSGCKKRETCRLVSEGESKRQLRGEIMGVILLGLRTPQSWSVRHC